MRKIHLLVLIMLAAVMIHPISSMSQATGGPESPVPDPASPAVRDGTDEPAIPGGIIPHDDNFGPLGYVGAESKFDDEFYQKIQELALAEPQDIDADSERYYNVIIVVSRDGGDADRAARENKDALAERLELLGARDIMPAESLSFVTASVPVRDIFEVSLYDEAYALGDGELPVVPEINTAIRTVHATPDEISRSAGRALNGSGIVVGVVDSGINSIYLNDKVTDRMYCPDRTCSIVDGFITGQILPDLDISTLNSTYTTHGTRVAQVIAASGMPSHNGIAPGVTILDASLGHFTFETDVLGRLVQGIDWSYSNGADIVNISAGSGFCTSAETMSVNMVVNEAVDKGMIVVKSAGNRGATDGPSYKSVTNPGCAHNIITVGGTDDRLQTVEMYAGASRGPTDDSEPRLVPHMAAPAHQIEVLDSTTSAVFGRTSGTSYAAPQASATAALMLEASPERTPAEIKAALLLGADWTGPIPCTSSQYESENPNDDCSHARQPSHLRTANNAASLGILNNVGFGMLNASESVRYIHPSASYVVSDQVGSNSTSTHRFTITDDEPVKIILTWMVHPHGGILEQLNRTGIAVPVTDLDLVVTSPSGTDIRAESEHQTTEFVVFRPAESGTYNVTVSYPESSGASVQRFALAGTSQLVRVAAPGEITEPEIRPIRSGDYAGFPEYLYRHPSLRQSCVQELSGPDVGDLPEFLIDSPAITHRVPECDLDDHRAHVFVYKHTADAGPHELVYEKKSTTRHLRETINLDDYGLGMYEIFYFLVTPSGANHLLSWADIPHTVATATLTVAPPPPEITSPPDGTQFLTGDRMQRINGTSISNVVVFLNVTEINTDGSAGDTREYNVSNNADNEELPGWHIDAELHDGDNRITAWVVNNDVRSKTDEIILHVVDQMLEAPEITSPENNARFADTDRTQTVRGTSDGDTVTLTLEEFDDGRAVNNMTHAGIAVGPEGTWSREVELFESATTRLVATSHVGRITSPESAPVLVHTAPGVCSTDISASLGFGILTVGDISGEGTLSFANTGTQESSHKIHGTDWLNPEQTTQVVMDVGQTRYHAAENIAYADKTALANGMTDAARGLAAGATEDLYLQVRAELDRPAFAGDIQQKITVSSTCG